MEKRAVTRQTAAIIAIVIIVVASLGIYFGTQPKGPSVTTTMPVTTARPTTLTIGFMVGVSTLDPAKVYIQNGAYDVMYNVFDPLVMYNPQTLELEGRLATSWQPSSGYTVWTFALRQNVKFTDGTSFNATAAKFTFDRILKANTGPAFEIADLIKSINVLDNNSIQFVLTRPFPPFPGMISGPEFGIVSPAAALAKGDTFGTAPVGTGPFMVTKFVYGSEVDLTANPNYFKGPAKIQNVIIKMFSSSSTAALALKNGEVQLIWDPLQSMAPADVTALKGTSGLVFQSWKKPYLQYLGMNTKAGRPLSDPRIRQAIADAINRTEVIDKVLGGMGYAPDSIVPPQIRGSQSVYNYPYDKTKAAALLKDAGVKPGQINLVAGFPSTSSVRQAVLTYVQSQLSPLGISVTLTPLDTSGWIQGLSNGQFDLFVIALAPDYADPYGWLQMFTGPAIPNPNRWFYNNTQVNRLTDMALGSGGNLTESNRLYGQAQTILAQDVPAIPMWGMQGYYLMTPKLQGLPNPNLSPHMSLWLYPAYLAQ